MTTIFRSSLSRMESTSSPSIPIDPISKSKTKKKRQRGPRFTRIENRSTPLFQRLVGTIFGDEEKSTKPSASSEKLEEHFQTNERTLHSLVDLLTQIESKVPPKTNQNEDARNNNRIEETSSSSLRSYSSLNSVPIIGRKMIDNQQQTHLDPIEIRTIRRETSWIDLMRDDPTTIDAWARIQRRLKPNEQKDILKALMIICANLFEVPLEKKRL